MDSDKTSWKDALSLEEFFKKCLREGREKEVLALIQNLPLESRQKYRELWKAWKEKKDA